ncbi:DHS-like NAD/FAD-binding domain-containing protein [Trichocladium antarcticum]|uniref:DHS-like NAD/FAD-binding domain-containing protein n=1 Tax=Trichocladium antarcticum TaxID=1450529 RepID=A0AAN6UBE0_9PEZI|nr:DHS-like NAD/FAD-binding domain-containing protein [Trichocladium antarcticum]
MPTTHVEPGCEPLLQDIADSLWKARKVVVITGAGISTNSGIPDFRSENGLYSLIQAQFDAAHNQGSGGSSEADTSDVSLDERPVKRQRVLRAGELASPPSPDTEDGRCGQRDVAEQHIDALGEGSLEPSYEIGPARNRSDLDPDIAMTEDLSRASPSTLLPGLRPPPSQIDLCRTAMAPPAPLDSSPPRPTLGTPRARSRPDPDLPHTWSSSPLSSPPQIMFDPYRSSSPSSSPESGSSRSQSEEPSSASTPLLTSQSSFGSSSRGGTLPNLKGRDLFDAQIWSCPIRTSVFYTFASTLRQKVRTAEPTSSHHFVGVLRDSMKLVRCYTQNIDQLEERVGLTTSLSLGAGNRYRFSARAGRNAGGARGSMKGPEGAPGDAGQGSSQQGEEQVGGERLQIGQAVESGQTDGADESPSATQSSQAGAGPNDIPSSTPSGPTPTAPKRGVECVFLHGSLAELRCFVCARTSSWDDEARLADTLAGRQPICPHCAGATAAREEKGKRALGVGKLRPDIVLYGEEHPHAHLISPLVQHDLSLCPDMLLILGTSMRVHGLRVLVKEFSKAVHDRGGKVVFVNFTKPPDSVWADIIDYWIQWDCDTWVGDLQKRKPALWLPLGAAPRDEEKPKVVKSSRKQSGGDALKRKDGVIVDKRTKKARKSDEPMVVQEPEVSALSIEAAPFQPGEMSLPLRPPTPKTVPRRAVVAAREPKLNPDAKRPASIRDHKQNGAYCVWKILDGLQRITGGSPSGISPSLGAATARSKAKRPRKSAPAVPGSGDTVIGQDTPVKAPRDKSAANAKPTAPESSPATGHLPYQADEPIITGRDSSISTAVKTRKRKHTVIWRMMGGVETRISLDIPQLRALPQPIPSPLTDSHTQTTTTTTTTRTTTPNRFKTITPIDLAIDAGFRETDRLIAKAHQEVQLASRPATPTTQQQQPQPQSLLVHLPPLHFETAAPFDPPALAALEPKVESPGPPRAEISSNVGSPVGGGGGGWWPGSGRAGDGGGSGSGSGSGNVFCMGDPGVSWLRFPPAWLEREAQVREGRGHHDDGRGYGEAEGGGGQGWWGGEGPAEGYRHDGEAGHGGAEVGGDVARDGSPWCPDEQLRKEQEAALMLSALRGLGA